MPRDANLFDRSDISVLVVDASHTSCDSLVSGLITIGQFARVCGSHTVRAAGRLAQTCHFDVALVSTVHGDGEGAYDFIRSLAGRRKPVRSLLIARHWKRPDVVEAFRSGARGLLSYEMDLPQISKAIACVMAGQVWANSEQLNHTLDYLVAAPGERRLVQTKSGLTTRELEIAQLLAKGASNKQIAKLLDISERTVKNHLRSIFGKMGVNSRVQAALHLLG
jgi:two-component system, NarL family, nitrate/nitrite response regulator NarL